jgi:hypothetical protein
MRLFNIDFHISVILDIENIFSDLGHSITDISLSDHAPIVGKKKEFIPDISNGKWIEYFTTDFAKQFNSRHPELSNFDGYISTYPPLFSILYLGYDKPSFVHIPIRFDYGIHSNAPSMRNTISTMQKAIESKKLIVTANNKYDAHYFNFLTGTTPEHIPSLCAYTSLQYNPGLHSKNVLIYAEKRLDKSKIDFSYDLKNNLPHGYKWNELLKYKAIVHFPYQLSTMSIFEHYTANIPLFFPSEELIHRLYLSGQDVLSQVSNYQLWNSSPKTVIPYNGDIDLNNYKDPATIWEWLQYADYYDQDWMPHIQYFDSFEDLNSMIRTTDFQKISDNMKLTNIDRKQKIYSAWRMKLNEIFC